MTKQSVLSLLMSSGAFSLFRFANRGRALILNYHRFSAGDEPEATSVRVFAEHLEYLKTHYRILPLAELVECLSGHAQPPHRLAAITIDDGYRDAYELAFPILRLYGVPATLFAVTDFISQRTWLWTDKLRYLTLCSPPQQLELRLNGRTLACALGTRAERLTVAARINALLKRMSDEAKDEAIAGIAAQFGLSLPELPPPPYRALTWDEAREMDRRRVTIESHTVTHPILTEVDDERLDRELSDSRAQLETELRRSRRSFCYPNGDYDKRVRGAVRRAGYRCAVTTEPGLNDARSDLLALRRVHSERDLAHFVQSTCGFEQLKNRFRVARASAVSEQVYG
ncbi:MAG TPA: polysaccharide deacetylase family protein [Blastocatellia bacterium]|nr:polysaccharide deacetylase family protein [Blastocatellia bacterium]